MLFLVKKNGGPPHMPLIGVNLVITFQKGIKHEKKVKNR